jgi:hypothetical protein
VTGLALEAEAGSVDKAQKVDRASAARQLATRFTLLGNNILSVVYPLFFPEICFRSIKIALCELQFWSRHRLY